MEVLLNGSIGVWLCWFVCYYNIFVVLYYEVYINNVNNYFCFVHYSNNNNK